MHCLCLPLARNFDMLFLHLFLLTACQDTLRLASRFRRRWAQPSVLPPATLQPLPSSLTRALDFASPNPPSGASGSGHSISPASVPAVPPHSMPLTPAWPAPSGASGRVPVPRAACVLPPPPSPVPSCRWGIGGYSPSKRPPKTMLAHPYCPAPLPVAKPYWPPSAVEIPQAPPPLVPSRSSTLLVPALASPALHRLGAVSARSEPVSAFCGLPDVGPSPVLSMTALTDSAKSRLSEQWLSVLSALGSASLLFREAAATRDPPKHMRHPILRFAPSTLQRYLADWTSWLVFCGAIAADPSDPPPGALPDWLSTRASKQGLATGPLRALAWMARVAGLPSLQALLQQSIVRAFAFATAPSERRESLPLPLCLLSSGWRSALPIRLLLCSRLCSLAFCSWQCGPH